MYLMIISAIVAYYSSCNLFDLRYVCLF